MPAKPTRTPRSNTPPSAPSAPAAPPAPTALVDRIGALPPGAIVEREATDRWRVHVRGVERYGHGPTFAEALSDYLTGTSESAGATAVDVSVRAIVGKAGGKAGKAGKAVRPKAGTSSPRTSSSRSSTAPRR